MQIYTKLQTEEMRIYLQCLHKFVV